MQFGIGALVSGLVGAFELPTLQMMGILIGICGVGCVVARIADTVIAHQLLDSELDGVRQGGVS